MLHIRDIHIQDRGLYQCQVLNGNGQQNIYNLTINVKVPRAPEPAENQTMSEKPNYSSPSNVNYDYDIDANYYDEFFRGGKKIDS